MAIRNIVKTGDDVLVKMCRPVEKFDEKLWTLLDDMAQTMDKAGIDKTNIDDVCDQLMIRCIPI